MWHRLFGIKVNESTVFGLYAYTPYHGVSNYAIGYSDGKNIVCTIKKSIDYKEIKAEYDKMLENVTNTIIVEQNISKQKEEKGEGKMEKTAYWDIWCGWKGNHDKRIDDGTCSNCGYKHHTVYGSIEKLAKYCPSCGSKMIVKEN